MIDHSIPFYENLPDNIHCCQASMKMVQEYFLPELKMTFDEWDIITAHKKDHLTWTMAGLLWFKTKGFDVVNIEEFDYGRFSEEGGKYLFEYYGKEVAGVQIKFSDIPQEMSFARSFISAVKLEIRKPSFEDMKNLIKEGYLIICNVNAHSLYGERGYSGHLVVVKGFTDDELFVNDPGLPSNENAKFAYSDFYRAWAYPDDKALNISALRLKK